jgi:hypothetical protein
MTKKLRDRIRLELTLSGKTEGDFFSDGCEKCSITGGNRCHFLKKEKYQFHGKEQIWCAGWFCPSNKIK